MEEKKIKHFVRVADADLIGKKPLHIALTKIYGVGQNLSHSICRALKIPLNKTTGTLNEEEIKTLNEFIKNPKNIPSYQFNRAKSLETGEDTHLTSSKLRLTKDFDIKRIRKNKSYKGMRHSWSLPVRGQRTRGNFRKGKAVGVMKKGKKGKKG